MKLAILLQCHKDAQQINLLLKALDIEEIDIYIHVDSKSDILDEIKLRKNIYILPDDLRVDVQWATFSQVEATINLLKYTIKNGSYDFYALISGQDFPLVKANKIVEFLDKNKNSNFMNLIVSKHYLGGKNNNFDKRNEIIFPQWIFKRNFINHIIRRSWVEITGGYNCTYTLFKRKQLENIDFYFGSQWWCINNAFFKYMINFINNNSSYINFYKKSSCPDESFFQTLLMNSELKKTRKDYLHYINWSEYKSSPKVLDISDVINALNSDKIFARKFDYSVNPDAVNYIYKLIK